MIDWLSLIVLFCDRTRSFTSDTNREGSLRDTREKKHILINENLENILKKSIARHEGTAFARITRPSVTDPRDGSECSSSSRIAVVVGRPNEKAVATPLDVTFANIFSHAIWYDSYPSWVVSEIFFLFSLPPSPPSVFLFTRNILFSFGTYQYTSEFDTLSLTDREILSEKFDFKFCHTTY